MKNSKTALNMLGVSSPLKQDEELRDISELMEMWRVIIQELDM